MRKKNRNPPCRRIVLRVPDLDHTKSAVLNSLSSPRSRRNYKFAMEQFITWNCSEPRLALNRAVVLRFCLYFDLILLAPPKCRTRWKSRPTCLGLLAPGGVILPIQNGWVARVLADGLGEDKILGGFSNLGATMVEPGVYEQKNAGHLVIGELAGGVSERVERVALDPMLVVKILAGDPRNLWRGS